MSYYSNQKRELVTHYCSKCRDYIRKLVRVNDNKYEAECNIHKKAYLQEIKNDLRPDLLK